MRRVQLARITMPSRDLEGRIGFLLEDALKTADFGDCGRLIAIRYLNLPRLPVGATHQAVERAVEGAWRTIAPYAVHCSHPGAGQAPAVYSQSRHEARRLWLQDTAHGVASSAWFWRALLDEGVFSVPHASPTALGDVAVRCLFGLITEAPTELATLVATLDATAWHELLTLFPARITADAQPILSHYFLETPTGYIPRVAADAADTTIPLLHGAHDAERTQDIAVPSHRQRQNDGAIFTPNTRAFVEAIRQLRWDMRDWRVCLSMIAVVRAHQPTGDMATSLSLLQHDVARMGPFSKVFQQLNDGPASPNPVGVFIRPLSKQTPLVPPTTDSMAASNVQPHTLPIVTSNPRDPLVRTEPTTQRTASPIMSTRSALGVDARATECAATPSPLLTYPRYLPWLADLSWGTHAGLLLLLNVLDAMGMDRWLGLQSEGVAENFVADLLADIARRVRLPTTDTQWTLLTREADARIQPCRWDSYAWPAWSGLPAYRGSSSYAAALAAWRNAVRRTCRVHANIGVASVVRRLGGVSISPTHVDVVFRLEDTDLRLRRNGLDRNPGWVPWFGWIVTFHFVEGIGYVGVG